jgi:hypothetical protein
MMLVDSSWVEEHKFDEINGISGAKCIRCGQCCLHIPCFWAQLWHGLTEENSQCPDLKRNEDGTYTCLMMKRDEAMRLAMLGTGCHYPEWRNCSG